MRKQVSVVIPVYKEDLSAEEVRSVNNTLQKLGNHDITLVMPDNINNSFYVKNYQNANIIKVTDEWLGVKNGLAGYNKMMLSEEFYSLFSDYEYILICHTDAWIFRDELAEWCSLDYDIVAPPWPPHPHRQCFPIKQYLKLVEFVCPGIHYHMTYGRVGNGGMSLRKVDSCRKACVKYRTTINKFISQKGKGKYNEDVFWALIPKEFKYPDFHTALKFGFDHRPALCYELSNHRLPMGCHGYTKQAHQSFWKQFIRMK